MSGLWNASLEIHRRISIGSPPTNAQRGTRNSELRMRGRLVWLPRSSKSFVLRSPFSVSLHLYSQPFEGPPGQCRTGNEELGIQNEGTARMAPSRFWVINSPFPI